MPDDKKDLIEPIEATFDEVVGAIAPRTSPTVDAGHALRQMER